MPRQSGPGIGCRQGHSNSGGWHGTRVQTRVERGHTQKFGGRQAGEERRRAVGAGNWKVARIIGDRRRPIHYIDDCKPRDQLKPRLPF